MRLIFNLLLLQLFYYNMKISAWACEGDECLKVAHKISDQLWAATSLRDNMAGMMDILAQKNKHIKMALWHLQKALQTFDVNAIDLLRQTGPLWTKSPAEQLQSLLFEMSSCNCHPSVKAAGLTCLEELLDGNIDLNGLGSILDGLHPHSIDPFTKMEEMDSQAITNTLKKVLKEMAAGNVPVTQPIVGAFLLNQQQILYSDVKEDLRYLTSRLRENYIPNDIWGHIVNKTNQYLCHRNLCDWLESILYLINRNELLCDEIRTAAFKISPHVKLECNTLQLHATSWEDLFSEVTETSHPSKCKTHICDDALDPAETIRPHDAIDVEILDDSHSDELDFLQDLAELFNWKESHYELQSVESEEDFWRPQKQTNVPVTSVEFYGSNFESSYSESSEYQTDSNEESAQHWPAFDSNKLQNMLEREKTTTDLPIANPIQMQEPLVMNEIEQAPSNNEINKPHNILETKETTTDLPIAIPIETYEPLNENTVAQPSSNYLEKEQTTTDLPIAIPIQIHEPLVINEIEQAPSNIEINTPHNNLETKETTTDLPVAFLVETYEPMHMNNIEEVLSNNEINEPHINLEMKETTTDLPIAVPIETYEPLNENTFAQPSSNELEKEQTTTDLPIAIPVQSEEQVSPYAPHTEPIDLTAEKSSEPTAEEPDEVAAVAAPVDIEKTFLLGRQTPVDFSLINPNELLPPSEVHPDISAAGLPSDSNMILQETSPTEVIPPTDDVPNDIQETFVLGRQTPVDFSLVNPSELLPPSEVHPGIESSPVHEDDNAMLKDTFAAEGTTPKAPNLAAEYTTPYLPPAEPIDLENVIYPGRQPAMDLSMVDLGEFLPPEKVHPDFVPYVPPNQENQALEEKLPQEQTISFLPSAEPIDLEEVIFPGRQPAIDFSLVAPNEFLPPEEVHPNFTAAVPSSTPITTQPPTTEEVQTTTPSAEPLNPSSGSTISPKYTESNATHNPIKYTSPYLPVVDFDIENNVMPGRQPAFDLSMISEEDFLPPEVVHPDFAAPPKSSDEDITDPGNPVEPGAHNLPTTEAFDAGSPINHDTEPSIDKPSEYLPHENQETSVSPIDLNEDEFDSINIIAPPGRQPVIDSTLVKPGEFQSPVVVHPEFAYAPTDYLVDDQRLEFIEPEIPDENEISPEQTTKLNPVVEPQEIEINVNSGRQPIIDPTLVKPGEFLAPQIVHNNSNPPTIEIDDTRLPFVDFSKLEQDTLAKPEDTPETRNHSFPLYKDAASEFQTTADILSSIKLENLESNKEPPQYQLEVPTENMIPHKKQLPLEMNPGYLDQFSTYNPTEIGNLQDMYGTKQLQLNSPYPTYEIVPQHIGDQPDMSHGNSPSPLTFPTYTQEPLYQGSLDEQQPIREQQLFYPNIQQSSESYSVEHLTNLPKETSENNNPLELAETDFVAFETSTPAQTTTKLKLTKINTNQPSTENFPLKETSKPELPLSSFREKSNSFSTTDSNFLQSTQRTDDDLYTTQHENQNPPTEVNKLPSPRLQTLQTVQPEKSKAPISNSTGSKNKTNPEFQQKVLQMLHTTTTTPLESTIQFAETDLPVANPDAPEPVYVELPKVPVIQPALSFDAWYTTTGKPTEEQTDSFAAVLPESNSRPVNATNTNDKVVSSAMPVNDYSTDLPDDVAVIPIETGIDEYPTISVPRPKEPVKVSTSTNSPYPTPKHRTEPTTTTTKPNRIEYLPTTHGGETATTLHPSVMEQSSTTAAPPVIVQSSKRPSTRKVYVASTVPTYITSEQSSTNYLWNSVPDVTTSNPVVVFIGHDVPEIIDSTTDKISTGIPLPNPFEKIDKTVITNPSGMIPSVPIENPEYENITALIQLVNGTNLPPDVESQILLGKFPTKLVLLEHVIKKIIASRSTTGNIKSDVLEFAKYYLILLDFANKEMAADAVTDDTKYADLIDLLPKPSNFDESQKVKQVELILQSEDALQEVLGLDFNIKNFKSKKILLQAIITKILSSEVKLSPQINSSLTFVLNSLPNADKHAHDTSVAPNASVQAPAVKRAPYAKMSDSSNYKPEDIITVEVDTNFPSRKPRFVEFNTISTKPGVIRMRLPSPLLKTEDSDLQHVDNIIPEVPSTFPEYEYIKVSKINLRRSDVKQYIMKEPMNMTNFPTKILLLQHVLLGVVKGYDNKDLLMDEEIYEFIKMYSKFIQFTNEELGVFPVAVKQIIYTDALEALPDPIDIKERNMIAQIRELVGNYDYLQYVLGPMFDAEAYTSKGALMKAILQQIIKSEAASIDLKAACYYYIPRVILARVGAEMYKYVIIFERATNVSKEALFIDVDSTNPFNIYITDNAYIPEPGHFKILLPNPTAVVQSIDVKNIANVIPDVTRKSIVYPQITKLKTLLRREDLKLYIFGDEFDITNYPTKILLLEYVMERIVSVKDPQLLYINPELIQFARIYLYALRFVNDQLGVAPKAVSEIDFIGLLDALPKPQNPEDLRQYKVISSLFQNGESLHEILGLDFNDTQYTTKALLLQAIFTKVMTTYGVDPVVREACKYFLYRIQMYGMGAQRYTYKTVYKRVTKELDITDALDAAFDRQTLPKSMWKAYKIVMTFMIEDLDANIHLNGFDFINLKTKGEMVHQMLKFLSVEHTVPEKVRNSIPMLMPFVTFTGRGAELT